MIDREVQVVTDSTAAIKMTEMIEAIEAEILAMREIRAEIIIVDRADLQKEEVHTETVEIIAETAAMTETGVTKEIETAIEAEIRIEEETIAEIEDPATIGRDRIRKIDLRMKDKGKKIGMTMIRTEEITVQGCIIHTKRRIAGNVKVEMITMSLSVKLTIGYGKGYARDVMRDITMTVSVQVEKTLERMSQQQH